jgi:hypothetical protein
VLPTPFIFQGAGLKKRCTLTIIQVGFIVGYNKDLGRFGILTMSCLVLLLDDELKGLVDG